MSDDDQEQHNEAPRPEAITGPPRRKKPDARYSDIHRGERWDVARFHPQGTDADPNAEQGDPFLWDIYFGASHVHREDAAPVDEKELAFKNKVEQTLGVLKAIYRPKPVSEDKPGFWQRVGKWLRRQILGASPDQHEDVWKNECVVRFREAYERLFSLTVLGLTAKNVDLRVADGALETLRNETLMREGGRIKNHYMFKLGAPAFGAAIFFVFLYLLYDKSLGFFEQICQIDAVGDSWLCPDTTDEKPIRALFPSEAYRFRAMFLLLAGCMIGTWLSFAARKVTLAFGDLAELEGDRLAPRMRLVFTGSLAVVFTLFFLTGIVEFRFSTMSTGEIMRSGTIALLVGLIFGLLEQSLPAAVMERASGLLNGGKTKT